MTCAALTARRHALLLDDAINLEGGAHGRAAERSMQPEWFMSVL
jgi:hypothetical protein